MPIEGALRELGIHDVFQMLDLSRKTGALRVTSEQRDNEGMVLFDRGRVVSASIRSSPSPLGTMLVRAGRITEDDLRRARELQDAGDRRRLGEILLGLGAIGARELERQVRLQIEAVVFELMSWRDGFFSFEESDVSDVALEASVHVSTESLLMEGARRIDEWSRMADRLPHLGVIPVLATVRDEHATLLDLLPSEWEVLAHIDGETDLRGIAASLGRSEFDVAKVVYGLLATGVIDIRDPGPAAALAPDLYGQDPDVALAHASDALARGQSEEALTAARGVIGIRPDSVEARLLAAQALRRLQRFGDAAEELRRASELAPDHPGIRLEQGVAAASKGDFNTAVTEWEHYLRTVTTAVPATAGVDEALAAARYLRRFLETRADG
jgi:tetratricopeptide (TPR) repeat protein